MADVYRAREPFAYTDKQGVPRSVAAGDLMSSDNPDFKGKEKLFEPVETAAARSAGVVEEATAEPGALRSITTSRRSRGSKAAKAEPEPAKPAEPTKPVEES